MMTTGSQIKTSSYNSTPLTAMTNFQAMIPEQELPLLMMISQDISTSKRQKLSQLSPLKKMLKLLLKEEMDLTEL